MKCETVKTKMFALLVAGQLVQTDVIQVEETKFLFNVTDLGDANHIVLFMTGTVPFPDGYGGAVYLNIPNTNNEACWQLLGHITNAKPSVIFKISGIKKDSEIQAHPFGMISAPNAEIHRAQVGVSIDMLSVLQQQTPVTGTIATAASTFADFTQKMLQTFYNYASSFAVSKQQLAQTTAFDGNTNAQYVPLSLLDKWFQEFQAKLNRDPNFWKT